MRYDNHENQNNDSNAKVSAISKAVMITVVIKQNQFRSLKNRIEIENKREIRKKKLPMIHRGKAR